MLQEQSRLFQRALFVADLVLVAVGWVAAYYLRFEVLNRTDPPSWLPDVVARHWTPPEWLPLDRYLSFLPWVLPLSMLVFWFSGLYVPDRAQRLPRLVLAVAKAVLLNLVVVMAAQSLYRTFYFSRLHVIFFGLITPALLVLLRLVVYTLLRRVRQQGKNRRRVLIVGAEKTGQRLAEAFRAYPWMGFEVVGFLDDHARGNDILGTTMEVATLVDRHAAEGTPIDYVYIALPLTAAQQIEDLVGDLSTRLAHVCLVPDLFQLDILNSRISRIDGLPVLHLIDEGPFEFRRLVKRGIDIAFSALFLAVISPLMLVIAGAVKLSSPGPVFYRQERMGLNGHTFEMLKFRSMPVDAEAKTGAVWAKAGEQRATRVGAFLRRTSLDELPQFINVLKGDMSVVGPRPERPVFIDTFRDRVPRYMLRHKMKAGITGWAQVNGWRGNTSIEKRIEYDLYYIQHWSLTLDFKIMLMTLWKGFVNEHAY